MPRREAWVDVPSYEGFKARLWVNYPRRFVDEIRSGDAKRLEKALCEIVLEHNGWADEDGNPLPPTTDPAFWAAIPDELAASVIVLLGLEVSKLPNSISAKPAN